MHPLHYSLCFLFFFSLLFSSLFSLSSSFFFIFFSTSHSFLLFFFSFFAQNLSIPFSSSPAFSSASLFLLSFHSPQLFFFHSFCLSPLSFASFSCSFFSFSLLLFSPYHASFRLNSFVPFFSLFFFCEGTACTVCFRGVGDDASDCDPIVIRL